MSDKCEKMLFLHDDQAKVEGSQAMPLYLF